MKCSEIEIVWPNGQCTYAKEGDYWLNIAVEAGFVIPTGCLGGSCGACEIEVNGKIIRACISSISAKEGTHLKVDLAIDPYW